MTPEELTRAVAERCMGWRAVSYDGLGNHWGVCGPGNELRGIPAYATDVAAAWEVVEWMRAKGYDVNIGCYSRGGRWVVEALTDTRAFGERGASMPEAVCLCALAVAEAHPELGAKP